MAELHQQYSEIMNMQSFELRGLVLAFVNAKNKTNSKQQSDGENTGDCEDEDYDTSMWFK